MGNGVDAAGGAQRSNRREDVAAMLLVSAVVTAVAAGFARGVWVPNLHNGLLALAFVGVGAYVVHQQPRNRCGPVFLATGTVEAMMFLGRQIGHDPGTGANPWWGWFGVWPLVVGLALVTVSVVLFPDGSLPSPGWTWVLLVVGILTTALAFLAALWPVGEAAAGVVTPHPFTVPGGDVASGVWDAVAKPTFVAFQALWLVAVVARWRTSGRTVRRQLVVVGGAAAVSLAALGLGLVLRGTPTAGVLAVCLVPVAAGWAIVHGQYLATHSAVSWLTHRSGDDAALPTELAGALADALAARRVVVWARRNGRYHPVGMWPDPTGTVVPVDELDRFDPTASPPTRLVRIIARGDCELGAVVIERSHDLTRHEEQLLDGLCGQAALVLEHLAAKSTVAADGAGSHLDHLTPREREVLALMAKGLTNAAICQELHLSVKTIEPTISSIFTKLGLPSGRDSNRRVLAVLAYVDAQRPTTSEV